jgi:hypothetical protein
MGFGMAGRPGIDGGSMKDVCNRVQGEFPMFSISKIDRLLIKDIRQLPIYLLSKNIRGLS